MRFAVSIGVVVVALAGCKKARAPIESPPDDPGRPAVAIPDPGAGDPEASTGPYPTASYAEVVFAESAVEVSPGGDIDGDGRADLLIGLPDLGRVHVVFGSQLARMRAGGTPTWDRTLESLRPGDRLGTSAVGVGDVDGDGTGDVLVGAPAYDSGAGDAGAAWLVLGSTLRDDPSAGLSAAWTFYWGAKNDRIGTGIASLGDLDGDGKSEALFPGYRRGYVLTGAQLSAYETFYLPDAGTSVVGSPEGTRFDEARAKPAGDTLGNGQGGAFVTWPGDEGKAWLFHGNQLGTKIVDLSSGAWGRFVTPGSWQGDVVCAADLNGDGRPDPIVSWYGTEPTIAAIDAGWFSVPAEVDLVANAFLVIDSDPKWAIHDVTSLGDLDGDGYAELAVGTRMQGEAESARVFVFKGLTLRGTERTGIAAADLVFDYPIDHEAFWYTTEVLAPGDLDGDGTADLAVVLRGFAWDDPTHTAAPRLVLHTSPWRW